MSWASRSGTSVMCRALRAEANLFGWNEGHLFPTLFPLLVLLWKRWQWSLSEHSDLDLQFNALGHLDVYQLLNAMLRIVDETYDAWCLDNNAVRWVDKTPTAQAVLGVGWLRHVYPQSRIVFMVRHPLMNALSYMRKFGESSATIAIRSWIAVVKSWLKVRQTLDAGSFLEVRQEDLTPRADEVAARVAALLELSPSEMEGVANYLRTERPERTGNSKDSGEILLEDLDWPEDVKRTCRELCAAPAAAFGYRLSRQ